MVNYLYDGGRVFWFLYIVLKFNSFYVPDYHDNPIFMISIKYKTSMSLELYKQRWDTNVPYKTLWNENVRISYFQYIYYHETMSFAVHDIKHISLDHRIIEIEGKD